MKTKLILIVYFVIFCNFLYSQDFLKFKNKIDSIKTKESSYKASYHGYWDFFFRKKLTKEEELQLVNYIDLFFDEDSLYNLHRVGYDLIYSLGHFSKNIETRQRVVEILFEKANYLYVDKSLIMKFHKEDYTNAAKERLKEIIFKGKTKKEIAMYGRFFRLGNTYKSLYIENQSKYIIKKTKSKRSLQFIEDSLYNSYLEKDLIDFKKSCCNEKLVEGIGWLEMKECIPQLKSLLSNNPYYEHPRFILSIKYTLAKLGVKKYEDEIISTDTLIDYKYLATERALYRYLELMYDTTKFFYSTPGRTYPVTYAYGAILNVQEYVLNFPIDLKLDQFNHMPSQADENKSRKGYQWLMDNKGKLILDKNSW
jgi:hypothetical protein